MSERSFGTTRIGLFILAAAGGVTGVAPGCHSEGIGAIGGAGGAGTSTYTGTYGTGAGTGTDFELCQATLAKYAECGVEGVDCTTACENTCVLSSSCEAIQSVVVGMGGPPDPDLLHCFEACSGGMTSSSGGMTSSSGGMTSSSGGMTSSSGMSSGGMTSSSGSMTSSSGGTTHPECVAYATKYCGCLGSAASADCIAVREDACESAFDFCASYFNCVTASACGATCMPC